ncbi:hypothetical protein ACFW04_011615 [Cataglyphis niger]
MRASIRRKHRALKTGKMESEVAMETRFKPIVEPLRPNNPILGNKGYKYRHVIAPLLQYAGAKTGTGRAPSTMRVTGNRIEYVHWDDPNELITRESKRCPKNLQTDKGKEFYNAEMRKFAEKHGVNHYSTYSVMKASIVERFNRTLKNSMWKYFTLNGTYKWIDALPRLVKEYNARKHRTIGARPVDVTPAIAEKLLNTVYSNIKIAAPAKFKPGDPIFRITKVQRTNLLKNSRNEPIAGGLYEHELLRVFDPDVYLVEKVLRRRGDEVYVKWLGMDETHNSWINKTAVLR